MTNFTPNLFISVGNTSAFFTLRETYEHVTHTGIAVRSYHIKNLSQDPDEALAKAEAFSEDYGVPLSTTRDTLLEKMRNITRRTPEQVATEKEEAQRRADEAHQERLEACFMLVKEGKYGCGAYRNQAFKDVPISYINWLIAKLEDFEPGSLMRFTAEQVKEKCSDLILPIPCKFDTVGKPKQRLVFNVTVINVVEYPTYDWNGFPTIGCITTMVTANNICLVTFSQAFVAHIGDKMTIRATIKEHTEYKGQAQTIIQRIAKVKEIK